MLDFAPNHTALDHLWVDSHPDHYVRGTAAELARAPQNYVRIEAHRDELILAHGRDPYFPGWPDTLQLDYGNSGMQEAMMSELQKIALQCDGVRCDMAMLVLPDVFERTWGRRAPPFWPNAIRRVRQIVPDFLFMAEAYWDLEWTMLQQGFDYAYDKRLYDRLRDQMALSIREHLAAGLDYQEKLTRFLENHDEPRAAATFASGTHEAAAVITYLSPGLRFFHQGQFEGRKKRISPHLVRAPSEPTDATLRVSTRVYWPCFSSPSCATVPGACSNARRPGTATGRGIVLSPHFGTMKTDNGGLSLSTMRAIKVSATSVFPCPRSRAKRWCSKICSVRHDTFAIRTISPRAVSIWTWRRGLSTSSRSRTKNNVRQIPALQISRRPAGRARMRL
jgi:hypothetical protein